MSRKFYLPCSRANVKKTRKNNAFFQKNTQAQAPSKARHKQIDELQKLYDLDFQANQSSLREYEEAKRYYHGEQLPPDVKAELQGRG